MTDPRRVAILISGRGSNMRALIDQATDYEIVLVASNRAQAQGLDYARGQGLPTWAWDSKGVRRADFEEALGEAFSGHGVGTIALAGYMRLLSPEFVRRWTGQIVNIHPSLLPKYPGLDTHARALGAGDTVSGCTVHLVTEEVDAGQVIAQAEVPIEPGDTAERLQERVLAAEHRLYPAALRQYIVARAQRSA